MRLPKVDINPFGFPISWWCVFDFGEPASNVKLYSHSSKSISIRVTQIRCVCLPNYAECHAVHLEQDSRLEISVLVWSEPDYICEQKRSLHTSSMHLAILSSLLARSGESDTSNIAIGLRSSAISTAVDIEPHSS